MVVPVYHPIQIHLFVPVCVGSVGQVITVNKSKWLIHVQAIHVKHVDTVPYPNPIRPTHVYAMINLLEIVVNEVENELMNIHHHSAYNMSLANPCVSSPCLNQAICEAHWNHTDSWFNCRCVGTFTGQRCETSLLNPCGGLCMNG